MIAIASGSSRSLVWTGVTAANRDGPIHASPIPRGAGAAQ